MSFPFSLLALLLAVAHAAHGATLRDVVTLANIRPGSMGGGGGGGGDPLFPANRTSQWMDNVGVRGGTAGIVSSNGYSSTLTNSLIYASKPSYFGNLTWPPYHPTNGAALAANLLSYTNIPAGHRSKYGTSSP